MDFRKAFDSVRRSALFLKLQKKGVGVKFYNLLCDMYSNTLYSCKYQTSYSKPFLANLGVKQRAGLSPTLFEIFVDDLGDYFNPNLSHPVNLQDEKFNHLLYDDDLLLLSESANGLQHCLDCLQKYSIDWIYCELQENPNYNLLKDEIR